MIQASAGLTTLTLAFLPILVVCAGHSAGRSSAIPFTSERLPGEFVTYRAASVTASVASLPGQGAELLNDGRLNPAAAFPWPAQGGIEFVFDLGRSCGTSGLRFTSARSWMNSGVKTASFHVSDDGRSWREVCRHVAVRPANTYKEEFVEWPVAHARYVRMTVEATYDHQSGYYDGYVRVGATTLGPAYLDIPRYDWFFRDQPTLQLAEAQVFAGHPTDLPEPNPPTVAFPRTRLVRDWLFQDAAVSNLSQVANTTADTTRPDRLGRDISSLVDRAADPAWHTAHTVNRRAFLAGFRRHFTQFVYVKHIVMGNSIMHATDDLTDASFQEWRTVPDYTYGPSQLVLATLREDGSVAQEVLLDEPHGSIRDPALSFDARTLVFSRRRNFETDNYHLWKMDLATRQLKQITFNEWIRTNDCSGLERDFEVICSDIEPCFLPDGSLIFQSTRCGHNVDCWPLPVSNLHRCEADGSRIRRIGFDQVQTFYPQVMEDGRVSFTRWEYQDRETGFLQKLCAMNPDGTRQTGLFGNNSEFPVAYLHARSIPGTDRLMATSGGHHTGQKGKIVELDPLAGDDYSTSTYDPAKAYWGIDQTPANFRTPGGKWLTVRPSEWDAVYGTTVPELPGVWYLAGSSPDARPGRVPVKAPRKFDFNLYDGHAQVGPQWVYPFPVDEHHFLVSFMPEGERWQRGPYSSRFGVYAMDADGRRELLAFDWAQHCMQPVPIRPRQVHPRTMQRHDAAQGFGTYVIQNVYAGAAMEGAPTGCVKRIRVVGLELRPVHIGWNWQFGFWSDQGKIGTPISVGNGAYDVKHVLGEAEIEADGSCSFLAPARTGIYFQLIDEKGCVVQTMRSWSTLQPGEVNGCVGCHEHPHQSAPVQSTARALKRPPQRLKPYVPGAEHPFLAELEKKGPLADLPLFMGLNRPKPVDGSDAGEGFSFSRVVQPILNAKCVSCHGEKHAVDLRDVPAELPKTDDQSRRRYSKAYLTLSCNGACNGKVNFAHALSFAPFRPPYSFGSARSATWKMLAAGHPDGNGKARVALSDVELRKIACWIDLCVPYCGTYVERNSWSAWHQQRYVYGQNKRVAFAWRELNDIRREKGLPPAPLAGFVPNVVEPRKQRYWSE